MDVHSCEYLNKKDTDDEKVPEDFDSEKGEYKDSID